MQDFKESDTGLRNAGMRLTHVDFYDSAETFTGLRSPGSGAQFWKGFISVAVFKLADKGHFDAGRRLVSIERHDDEMFGVWRTGNGGQYWATGQTAAQLKALDDTYFAAGLRMKQVIRADDSYTRPSGATVPALCTGTSG